MMSVFVMYHRYILINKKERKKEIGFKPMLAMLFAFDFNITNLTQLRQRERDACLSESYRGKIKLIQLVSYQT